MKKVWLILLAVTLVFGLGFFGCNDPEEEKDPPPEGFEEIPLTMPDAAISKPTAETGEGNSKMFVFSGEDFTKIKAATPGSYLEVTYKVNVAWGTGEVGWIDITKAGPTLHGDASSSKTKTAKVPVEDVLLGDDSLTIHMFNNGDLLAVTLMLAPEDFVVEPHAKATAGATKLWVPYGGSPHGKGDVTKVDITKILAAADTAKMVFYFADDETSDSGILKVSAKYNHTKNYDPAEWINTTGKGAPDDNSGWSTPVADGKSVTLSVGDIKAAMTADPAITKLDINLGAQTSAAGIIYMELIP